MESDGVIIPGLICSLNEVDGIAHDTWGTTGQSHPVGHFDECSEEKSLLDNPFIFRYYFDIEIFDIKIIIMPTHFKGSRAERRTLDTFIKLTRCTNSVLARLAERKTIGDLTPSQFAVLEAVYHLGPLTQGEVSAKVLKSVSNITTVIDNLEREGLVRRERDRKDRRVVYIYLTEAGKNKVETVLPVHVAALVAEFSILTEGEQEALGDLCKKLGEGSEAK
jgi:MarR family 2-MHQ and catechol resistance regulon transcriptional repressor